MTWDVLGLAVSLVVLTVAGDQFVIGVARLAALLGVRAIVVGVLVGGFGTSLPELIVAGAATARGTPQLAVGSLVGSIIANVSLGLAIAALVAPVRVDSKTVRREAPLSLAAVLLFGLLVPGGLSRSEGFVLVVALVLASGVLLVNARLGTARDELAVEVTEFYGRPTTRARGRDVVRTLLGVAFMIAGAELLVRAAADLADRLGLAEGFVGLTIVALGTSAPLIVAAIQAARRGEHDLVVGNVLGCSLFIALMGGAIVAFLPNGSAPGIGADSLWLMAGVTLAAWAFMARGRLVTRWEAAILLLAYAVTLPFVAE